MKKIFFLIVCLCFFSACSKEEITQKEKLYSGQVNQGKVERGKSVVEATFPKPSTSPFPGCEWKEVSGYRLHFRAQECQISGTTIHISPSKTVQGFVTEYSSGSEFIQDRQLVRVFEIKEDIESVLSSFVAEGALGNTRDCAFEKLTENGIGSGGLLDYFVLSPVEKTATPVFNLCGKYGASSADESSYFIAMKDDPSVLVYVNQNKLSQFIDEKSITIEN